MPDSIFPALEVRLDALTAAVIQLAAAVNALTALMRSCVGSAVHSDIAVLNVSVK